MSDNDKVICPNCVHEFVAVPVNVQAKVAQLEEDYGRACKLVAGLTQMLKEARWRLVEAYPAGGVPVVVQMAIARIDAAMMPK